MVSGTVKFWIASRGYGFIVPSDGSPDVFVHAKELHQSNLQQLTEGQSVQFEVAPGRGGKPKAVKVELVR